jgi:hypothetical protein
MVSFVRSAAAYFDPLHNKPSALKDEFYVWDKPARIIQIRFITLLTGLLYILYAGIEDWILAREALAFSTFIHFYFLPPLLFLISAMTMYQKLYRVIMLILAIAPVLANIGNLYLIELLRTSPIYLSEAYSSEVYLIVIWIFALSGLRFLHAFISASICCVMTLGYQIYFPIPDEIFYLHQLWMFAAFSFGVMSALILEKNNKRIFLDAQLLERLLMKETLREKN